VRNSNRDDKLESLEQRIARLEDLNEGKVDKHDFSNSLMALREMIGNIEIEEGILKSEGGSQKEGNT